MKVYTEEPNGGLTEGLNVMATFIRIGGDKVMPIEYPDQVTAFYPIQYARLGKKKISKVSRELKDYGPTHLVVLQESSDPGVLIFRKREDGTFAYRIENNAQNLF